MEENEKKIMEEDLFVVQNDNREDFIRYYDIPIKNTKTKKTSKYKFGIREISGYAEDRLSENTLKDDGKGNIRIEAAEANIKYLIACLAVAPFVINEENIRKLSSKVRNYLIAEAKKVNSIDEDLSKK